MTVRPQLGRQLGANIAHLRQHVAGVEFLNVDLRLATVLSECGIDNLAGFAQVWRTRGIHHHAARAHKFQSGLKQLCLQAGEFSNDGLRLAPPCLGTSAQGSEPGTGGVDKNAVIPRFQSGSAPVGGVHTNRQITHRLLHEFRTMR